MFGQKLKISSFLYISLVGFISLVLCSTSSLSHPRLAYAQSQYPLNQTFPNGQAAEVSLYNGSQTVKYAVKNCGELTALLNSFLSATQVETCGSELIKAYSEGSYPLVDTLDFMVILGGTTSWSTNSFSTDGTVSWLNGSFSVPPLFHFNNVERQYMFQGGTTNILPVSITDQVYNKDFTELETGCSSSSGAVGYFTPTGTLYNNWSGPTGGTAPGSEQYILGKTYASDMPSLPSLNPFVTSQGPEACAEEAAANGGSWHYRSELDFSGPAIPDPIATLTGPTQDHQNQNFNLTYTLPQGVQSASVNQGVGSLPLTPLDSSVKVTSFPTTTTYTLTVSAIADPTVTNSPVVTVVKTDTVHIYNPTVTKFWYTTNPTNYPAYIGGQVILNWITTDASNITITDPTNKTIATATTNAGAVTIPTPAQSTTYTLVASNVEGQTKATANVAPTYAKLTPNIDNISVIIAGPNGRKTQTKLPGNYGSDSTDLTVSGVRVTNTGAPANGTAYFHLQSTLANHPKIDFCDYNQPVSIVTGQTITLGNFSCDDVDPTIREITTYSQQTTLSFSFVLDVVMDNGINVENGTNIPAYPTPASHIISSPAPLITWAAVQVHVLAKDNVTGLPQESVYLYSQNPTKLIKYESTDDNGNILFIPLLTTKPTQYEADLPGNNSPAFVTFFTATQNVLYKQVIKTDIQETIVLAPYGNLPTGGIPGGVPADSGSLTIEFVPTKQTYSLPLTHGRAYISNENNYPNGQYILVSGSHIVTTYDDGGFTRTIPFSYPAQPSEISNPFSFTLGSVAANPLVLGIPFTLPESCQPNAIAGSIKLCALYPQGTNLNAVQTDMNRFTNNASSILSAMKDFPLYPATNLTTVYLGPSWRAEFAAFFNPLQLNDINVATDYSGSDNDSSTYDATVYPYLQYVVSHETFHLLDHQYVSSSGTDISAAIPYAVSIGNEVSSTTGSAYWDKVSSPCGAVTVANCNIAYNSAELKIVASNVPTEAFATELGTFCVYPNQAGSNLAKTTGPWQTATIQRLTGKLAGEDPWTSEHIAGWYKDCTGQ